MDLIWGRPWCSSVRPIPASVSSLLLCSSCPCARVPAATSGPSATPPQAVVNRPGHCAFSWYWLLWYQLWLPCLVSLTQASNFATVEECLSLTGCMGVCCYFLFFLRVKIWWVQIWVGEDDDNLSTHPGIFQMLPPFWQRLIIFQHTPGSQLSTTLGPE